MIHSVSEDSTADEAFFIPLVTLDASFSNGMLSCGKTGSWFRLKPILNYLSTCDIDKMPRKGREVQTGERKDNLQCGGNRVVVNFEL